MTKPDALPVRFPTVIRWEVEKAFDEHRLIDYACAEIERLEGELAEARKAISDVKSQLDTWMRHAAATECVAIKMQGEKREAEERAERDAEYASACREALLATEQFLDIALPPEAWARLLAIVRAALAKNPNPSGQNTTEASDSAATEASGPVGLGPHDGGQHA